VSATYDLADSVKLTFTVRKEGALTDATVALTVTKPDGTQLTQPGLPISNPAAGTYTAVLAPDLAGLWTFRWVATGTATTAEDGQFIVEALLGPTLYATVDELREQLGDVGAKVSGARLEQALRAVCRAIDKVCGGRRFWQDPTPTVHVYRPEEPGRAFVDDIAATAGLIVKVDTAGDGTWATTWTLNSHFQLEPLNADAAGGAYAWWLLVALGGNQFPTQTDWRPSLQVTARHGWSQVPEEIREAAIINAVKLWRRKDAPFGAVGGLGELAVRITREDPHVLSLLEPYMKLQARTLTYNPQRHALFHGARR